MLAEVRGQVRDALQKASLEAHFGPIVANMAIGPTIREWQTGATVSPALASHT
ncbi:hypothetical protein D3C83_322590 [compost metagenome]